MTTNGAAKLSCLLIGLGAICGLMPALLARKESRDRWFSGREEDTK